MLRVIEYLKDPYLVLKVQNYYGIYNVESKKFEENLSVNNISFCKNNDHNFKQPVSNINLTNARERNQNGSLLKSNKFSDQDDIFSSDSESESKNYVITNLFWYYLFIFGTELGDEIFYATFIPFWFWNIDGAVGRRVVIVWTIVMYIGQGIKDLVCWPRPPSPPVFRLQQKWAQEYGMPSTHAMVGISIPFSIVLYTYYRYQYPLIIGLIVAFLWCTVMCVSRIYLGMHSVIDVVAGLILALLLMIPLVPLVDRLDYLILTNKWSPVILIFLSIFLIVFYPKGRGGWTPTRGDTTLIISVCVGVLIGAWANYQLGEMHEPTSPPPYNVIWPSYEMLGLGVLRTVIGICCIVGTRALCKSILYAVFCYITCEKIDTKEDTNERVTTKISSHNESRKEENLRCNIIADLCHKYFTYIVLGFTMLYILPKVFRLLRIERPTFYTEI